MYRTVEMSASHECINILGIMRTCLKRKCHFFYRVKLEIVVLCVVIIGMLFLIYQIFLLEHQFQDMWKTRQGSKYEDKNKHNEVSESEIYAVDVARKLMVRGIHPQDIKRYSPNSQGKFVCTASKDEIDFIKVNDEYCDCPEDGSDEPGTDACAKGKFVCNVQGSNVGFSDTVPSNRVNDGICDCCDGSDEWKNVTVFRLKDSVQKKLGRYQPPCPNLCL